MRSASVDFPWSIWAMIEKFRMWAWSAMGARRGYDAVLPSLPRMIPAIWRASGMRSAYTAAM
jgi:hypothetical protein